MKLSHLSAVVLVSLAAVLAAQETSEKPAKEPGKVQKALGAVGRGVDKVAGKTKDVTVDAAGKTKDATVSAAGKTKDTTVSAAGKTKEVTKTAAGKTADATTGAAKATAGGAKTVASKTASGAEIAGRTTAGATGSGLETAGKTIKKAGMLDINTATESELEALPGIGDAYAAKIVAGRPYKSKNELVDRGVIPESAYKQIKNRVVAKQPKTS